MKGYHFFLEYASHALKRKGTRKAFGEHQGNVVAVDNPKVFNGSGAIECIGAVYESPNSHVATTATNLEYLHQRCLKISEAQAREIHPQLFAYLD